MRPEMTLLIVFLFIAAAFVLIRLIRAAGFYGKLRGQKMVTCPEAMKPATLHIAAGRAALEALLGKPDLRIVHCSHWPERRNCAQLCRFEIEAGPDVPIPEPDRCD